MHSNKQCWLYICFGCRFCFYFFFFVFIRFKLNGWKFECSVIVFWHDVRLTFSGSVPHKKHFCAHTCTCTHTDQERKRTNILHTIRKTSVIIPNNTIVPVQITPPKTNWYNGKNSWLLPRLSHYLARLSSILFLVDRFFLKTMHNRLH